MRPVSRRAALALGAALVVLAALVPLGRFEARHHARAENAELARIRALVGPLDRPPPDSYRLHVGIGFDCLLWDRQGNPYALELCFDARGRLIEAIDRRSGEPKIASLRDDPEAASVEVDRREVDRLLRRLGAPIP